MRIEDLILWVIVGGLVIIVANWWDKFFDRNIWSPDNDDDDQPPMRRREADQQPEE